MSIDNGLSSRAKNSWQKWTDATEDQLRALAEAGESTQSIAKAMNRTQMAVAHRANRLGLRLRSAPSGSAAADESTRREDYNEGRPGSEAK